MHIYLSNGIYMPANAQSLVHKMAYTERKRKLRYMYITICRILHVSHNLVKKIIILYTRVNKQ